VFTLTIEQFKQFCTRTEYLLYKGITKSGYTIDRINHERGYEIDNIQVLTNSENVKKMHLRREGTSYKFQV